MKRLSNKTQKVVKGMPSAVVLSILIHAGLFLLAGLLVVFTILPPKEASFEPPPPVKRPKMPLRKIQMKVKKPSKPKASAKLTAVVKKPDLHEIAFPDLPTGGMGSGIGDGGDVVSFVELPDFEESSSFGTENSIGNDLEVTFYDLKRRRTGQYNVIEGDEWRGIFRKFFREGWDTSVLSRYYRAPKKLYATNVVIPATASYMAPEAFGEGDAPGTRWIALYKGQIVHQEDITFRFWVAAEDSLAIRINEEVVIAASFVNPDAPAIPSDRALDSYDSKWESDSHDSLKYVISNSRATVGDWVTLKAGEPQKMEMVLTDNVGFGFTAIVAVEVKGVEYERREKGGPLLPVFRTSELSHEDLDRIYADLAEGELSCTNGPIFRDF